MRIHPPVAPAAAQRRRAGRGAAAILAVAALAGLVPGALAKLDPTGARRLPWLSQGGLVFHLDAASFPGDSADARRTEFYVHIPGTSLVYGDTAAADSAAADSAPGTAEVRYDLRVKDARGRVVHEEARAVRIPARELGPEGWSPGHVLLLTAPLGPGWHEVRLELSDLRSKRPGLAYVGRNVHREGKAEGVFFVPDVGVGPVAVSELEAAASIRAASGPGPFTRGAAEVLPSASRAYGLYQPTLRAYYEVRLPGGAVPLAVTAHVRDASGRVVLEAEPDSLAGAGARWGQVAFDVSTLPAGAYDLAVTFGAGATAVVRSLRVSVAWRPETWRGDPRQLRDEVGFLLDDADLEERFAQLTPGEQEAYLDVYWAARDPDPGTADNEARRTFEKRVAYANAHFGTTGMVKGMLSDRGRILIRYGEPDEIRREVMPTQGLQVEDIARSVATEEGNSSAVRLRGRGGGGDMRSFEIWYYDRLLHRETEQREGSGPRRPMKQTFVFVDEEGYGDYVLRYQNE